MRAYQSLKGLTEQEKIDRLYKQRKESYWKNREKRVQYAKEYYRKMRTAFLEKQFQSTSS